MKAAQMKTLVVTLSASAVGDEVALDVPEMLPGLGAEAKTVLVEKRPSVGNTSTFKLDVTMLGVHLYYVTIVEEKKGSTANYTLEIE